MEVFISLCLFSLQNLGMGGPDDMGDDEDDEDDMVEAAPKGESLVK